MDKLKEQYNPFPPVQRTISDLSTKYKSKYFQATEIITWLLVIVPLLLFFTAYLSDLQYTNLSEIVGIVSVILLVLSLTSELLIINHGYAKKWQICRSVAESLKRESWFYCSCMESYPKTDSDASNIHWIQVEKELLQKLIDNRIFLESGNQEEFFITTDMEKVRNLKVLEKWNFYKSARLQEQITWYDEQSNHNRNLKRNYSILLALLMAISVISAVVLIFLIKNYIEITEIVVASILATKTYSNARQFDSLEFTYNNTFIQLTALRDENKESDISSESRLIELVKLVENTISREHEVWVIKSFSR